MKKQQIVEQILTINQVKEEKKHLNQIEKLINSLTFELQAFSIAFYIKSVGDMPIKGEVLANWFSKNEGDIKNVNLDNLLKEVNAFL